MSSLILASASPRRAQLLRSAGVRFVVCTSHTTELEAEHLTPFETAQVNAYRKAYAVAKSHPDSTVLGADTVVHLDEQFFGKPTSMRDAERMLGVLQGRAHLVVTGVCLLHGRSRRRHTFAVSTSVTFRKLSLEAIRDYLSRVNPLDKAGAYGIQEEGHLIVEAVDGSYSNVVGLPMLQVLTELRNWPIE